MLMRFVCFMGFVVIVCSCSFQGNPTVAEKEIEETTIESMLPKYKLPKDTSLDTKKYVELFE